MKSSFFGPIAFSAETPSAQSVIPGEFGSEQATGRGVQKWFALKQATEFVPVSGGSLCFLHFYRLRQHKNLITPDTASKATLLRELLSFDVLRSLRKGVGVTGRSMKKRRSRFGAAAF